MKKILIAIILLFLVGCSSSSRTTEFISRDLFVPLFSDELDVCEEDCISTNEDYRDIFDGYREVILNIKLSFTGEQEENLFLMGGAIYDRETIPRHDPFTENLEVPVYYPFDLFEVHLFYMDMIVKDCSLGVCDSDFAYYTNHFVNINYKFNETEGMYSYLMQQGEEVFGYTELKYIISDDKLAYERIVYDDNIQSFDYNRFDGTLFEEIKYTDGYGMTYSKINVETYDMFYYVSNDKYEYIDRYDSETNIFTRLYFGGTKTMKASYYDELEFVTSLEKQTTMYTNKISFHFVGGWDQLEYKPEDLMPNSRLLNEGEEVFSEFSIFSYNQGSQYYQVNGTVIFNEEDLDTYTYPEEYYGQDVFDDLLASIENMSEMEEPLQLVNKTKSELTTFLQEQLVVLQANYEERTE